MRRPESEIELAVDGEPPPIRRATRRCSASPRRRSRTRSSTRTPSTSRSGCAGDGRLLLEVEDDGIGFDPTAEGIRSRRLGLTSMEERAERIGGTLEIVSAPGAGTTVRLEAPDA